MCYCVFIIMYLNDAATLLRHKRRVAFSFGGGQSQEVSGIKSRSGVQGRSLR